jgi:2-aminoadipate transaminase
VKSTPGNSPTIATLGVMTSSTPSAPALRVKFADRTERLRSSAIRDLLKLTQNSDILSMAGGLPCPESFPIERLRRESDRLLGEFGSTVLQYSATDGLPDLRDWIASHSSRTFGREVVADGEIVVTHGSQQALDLLAKILINPGDVIVSESPAYLGAIQAMELFEPSFHAVEGDEHGMQVEVLERQLREGLRPKFVYVVANFHNPSGGTLSLERRRLLASLADEFSFLIIEDDPYGAIRFYGDPVAPIASFTRNVVYLSTFSKIVAPGFRIGWMIGPPDVMAMAVKAKQAADLHTSTFAQQLLANVVREPGWIEEQQKHIVPIYRDRCDALIDAFTELAGDRVRFHKPDGGMFLWTTIPEVSDTNVLLAAAVKEGVAFVPGSAFLIDQQPSNTARFSYATLTPDQLHEATRRLVRALDSADGT